MPPNNNNTVMSSSSPIAPESSSNIQSENNGGIQDPHDNDVLFGRGGNINVHPGNETFRKMVHQKKRVYLTARFKREKRLIVDAIIESIQTLTPPGRFVARDMKSALWIDVGITKARDKTSQALRENAPSIRKEIEVENDKIRAQREQEEAAEWERRHFAGQYPHNGRNSWSYGNPIDDRSFGPSTGGKMIASDYRYNDFGHGAPMSHHGSSYVHEKGHTSNNIHRHHPSRPHEIPELPSTATLSTILSCEEDDEDRQSSHAPKEPFDNLHIGYQDDSRNRRGTYQYEQHQRHPPHKWGNAAVPRFRSSSSNRGYEENDLHIGCPSFLANIKESMRHFSGNSNRNYSTDDMDVDYDARCCSNGSIGGKSMTRELGNNHHNYSTDDMDIEFDSRYCSNGSVGGVRYCSNGSIGGKSLTNVFDCDDRA